ncbi:MAG TPA: alpha/beta fold hydrolase [Gemmatimonadaceae bacterium]|nr:alpha/beta fold hydrolase [Gemmatimonadaceae bacterium]
MIGRLTALALAFRRFTAAVITAFLCVESLPAQTPSSNSPPDSILAYAGAFRIGAAHDFVIAPFRAGGTWMLLFADLQSDALRFLTPTGSGMFTIGAETVRPTPVDWKLNALRERDRVEGFTITPESTSTRFVARRIAIDLVPVEFTNGMVRLQGTLYRPRSARGKLPLVVLAHGSEENDRWSFGPIPLALAANGFALLAYDKRGTGSSTGDWRSAGLEELADDLVAGTRAVLARGDVDSNRVAILGLSEGGWVAPLAASRFAGIRAIAAISGGARTKGDAYVFKTRREAEGAGVSADSVAAAEKNAREFIATSVARARSDNGASGFARRVAYDPTSDWQRFRGPVLYMGGEADVLESAPEAADWFRRLFARSGNPDATIRVWPRAHHSLLLGVTGDPAEFRTLRGIKQLAPGYWDVLLGWLETRVSQ